MKKTTWIFALVGIILVAALGVWLSHKHIGKGSASNSSSAIGVKPPTPPPTFSSSIKSNDWQEFRSDRQAALEAHPDLASEYKGLMTEMLDQQKELESA